jgi:predicted ribosomally synthesized peptide with SipW-like signal peptide
MKKKIFGITLAVCILVLSIASTTIAYFTDTDYQTQVFTAGNVDIKLTFTKQTTRSAFPGQSIESSAIIENKGTEDAYVGAIITFNKTNIPNGIEGIFKWADNTTVTYNSETRTIYVIYNQALVAGSTATPLELFDEMLIPATWGNNQMALFQNPDFEITITAYATQTAGLESVGAAGALNAAFDTVWPAPSPSN